MILFVFLAVGLVTYNTKVDQPKTQSTKEVYEKMKKERQ